MKKNKSSSRDAVDQMTMKVKYLDNVTLAAGINNIAVTPASFLSANQCRETYAFYRFKALRYRIHPNATITANQGAVFIAGVTDTAPSSMSEMQAVPHSTYLPIRQTVPSAWGKVPAEALKSYVPWFKTVVGTPDLDTETQGVIFLRGTGAETLALEVDATVQFRGQVVPGATPAERGALEVKKERERLLAVLSTGRPTSSALAGK